MCVLVRAKHWCGPKRTKFHLAHMCWFAGTHSKRRKDLIFARGKVSVECARGAHRRDVPCDAWCWLHYLYQECFCWHENGWRIQWKSIEQQRMAWHVEQGRMPFVFVACFHSLTHCAHVWSCRQPGCWRCVSPWACAYVRIFMFVSWPTRTQKLVSCTRHTIFRMY